MSSLPIDFKKCTSPDCKEPIKHKSEFYHNSVTNDGYTFQCKECLDTKKREYNKKRQKKNRAKDYGFC
jgi:hypothetical protein